jgi:hypothetical protein
LIDISLPELPLLIRNKVILAEYPYLTVMLLNYFLKRLLRNEAVNEEEDDVFRGVYLEKR